MKRTLGLTGFEWLLVLLMAGPAVILTAVAISLNAVYG